MTIERESPSLAALREIHEFLEARSIKPRVVQTEEEARRMTAEDPLGHQWRVGEAYHVLKHGRFV